MTYSDFLDEVRLRREHAPLDVSQSTEGESLPRYILIKEEVVEEMLDMLWGVITD
jgi:hypothetical protein